MGSKRTSFFNNMDSQAPKKESKPAVATETPAEASSAAERSPGPATRFRGWLTRDDEGSSSGDSLSARRQRETRGNRSFFRLIFLVVGGMVVLFLLTFIITFMVSVKGREHTVVPDITGKPLVDGIAELQERGLNIRVVTKYSDSPEDMGRVLEQRPVAGLTVKAGRKVSVVVSKGAVVDRIADYRGREITDVVMEIESLFVNYKPLIKVRQPIQYVYNESEPGTILEQDIEPGSPLSGLVEIQFVVSRGSEDLPVEIPNYMGLSYQEAIRQLSSNGIPFTFKIQEDQSAAVPEVVFQTPSAGDKVMPGTPVTLSVSRPRKPGKNEVFGLFEHELPAYEGYVQLKVFKQPEEGDPEPVFFMSHTGGMISFPYLEQAGTIFILYVYDQEVHRFQVVP